MDLWVTDTDGVVHFHQCKKNDSVNNWTIRHLGSRGVLTALRNHLARDARHRFVFVSNREATPLKRLTEAAARFEDRPQDFLSYLSSTQAERKAWEALCEVMDLPPGAVDAFRLLLRTEVFVFDGGLRDRQEVQELAGLLLDGDARDIVLCLADYAIERMGRQIHVDEVRRFIDAETTFRPRDLAYSSSIDPVIRQCKAEYLASVRPHLIDGQLIHRAEARALLDAISRKGGPRVHCLHGTAGQGKSCVLYELCCLLEEQGIPFLPIRFDRQLPRDNTRAFGNALGLPESPARCLGAIAGKRVAAVILDQLDALSWSPQHDPSAWLVFERLVSEALRLTEATHVVVACRTFALRNDPNVSRWRQAAGHDEPFEDLPVTDLVEEDVRALVEGRGVPWSALTGAQQRLLRKPQHLYLWSRLPADQRTRIEFRSATSLMRAFWQYIRDKLAEQGMAQAEVDAALEAVVMRLDEIGELTAPSRVLDRWPNVRNALSSLDVIEADGQRVRFTHQSYLDYYLAELWLERLRRGGKSVLDWIAGMDEQSLLRRAQLRQLLAVLRDDDPRRFRAAVREILGSELVRFHLQHLALQFLARNGFQWPECSQ